MTTADSSYLELKDTLFKVLEQRGILEKLRAEIRAELFAEIDLGAGSEASLSVPAPPAARETVLLNELFRDYLAFNGYEHTLSVFLAETAQPREPVLSRQFLRKELGISELRSSTVVSANMTSSPASATEAPLLYSLLAGYVRNYFVSSRFHFFSFVLIALFVRSGQVKAREMQQTLQPLVQRQETFDRATSGILGTELQPMITSDTIDIKIESNSHAGAAMISESGTLETKYESDSDAVLIDGKREQQREQAGFEATETGLQGK